MHNYFAPPWHKVIILSINLIKLDEENSGEIDEIIMLGKVLAHEVEENSENWDYDLVQEAKSITRKINNRCM